MPNKAETTIIDQLGRSISDDVGNMHEDNLQALSTKFNDTLGAALKKFNSTSFDDDGFIKRMRGLRLEGNSTDKDVVKNVLNSVKTDYINTEALQQTEILLRRDINNICTQMPEMRDVITLTRDNIIEANTATGEVSRTLVFKNVANPEVYESQVQELEERYELLPALKDFIVPNTLMSGEKYVHVVPYAKLFAELELMNSVANGSISHSGDSSVFKESIPNYVRESFQGSVSLYSEENLETIMESVSFVTKQETSDEYATSHENKTVMKSESVARQEVGQILKNIDIYNGSSVLMAEMGEAGFRDFIHKEYIDDKAKRTKSEPKSELDKFNMYMESYMNEAPDGNNLFNKLDQDEIDTTSYSKIKGCYIKYMDSLRMVPIRMGRRVVGYYYATTTMDLQNNPGHPNGIVDLSFQHYTRDRGMVEKLATMIIRSFNKKTLDRNIQLKNEIADVIMAHKFAEGRLSFIYIPENEIVRFAIDEDEDGKGHSMIEPTLFPARSYLMLNLYNMLYTLNNNTTRIHYLKSSGLNKNYAAQIQRTMRKFQSRRITIDDIYSYSGVLNKIGGMGEMVLPAGRGGDGKALETDTIEAVNNPINTEFIEQQRRQALSGTGAPNLLIINAIDEVDFAKTVELANARYQSRCGALKLNFNKGETKLYQKVMKACTDIDDDVIKAFKFVLNSGKQQDLNITSDMINNFTSLVELTMNIYGNKKEWEDEKGNPTNLQKHLRKAMAMKYFPQLEFDELDELVDQARLAAKNDDLQDKVADLAIEDEDIDAITSKKQ